MVELFIYLFFIVLGIGALLTGFIALGYALYGWSISGFDKTVRNFSFGVGIVGFSIAIGSYYFLNHSVNPKKEHLVGTYKNIRDTTQTITLNKDGEFSASSELFVETKGKWKLIDEDEFYMIQFFTENDRLFETLNILEFQNQMVLKTTNQFTNIESHLEFKKVTTTKKTS